LRHILRQMHISVHLSQRRRIDEVQVSTNEFSESFVGSILVALVANYVGFIEPKLALISNILVMALVLIWRPQGLFPVARR